MGLDMYLSKKIYVWRENRHKLKLSGFDKEIDPQKVSYIVEEAGYWRKANAIHGWFVDNVQEDVDDCKEYYVSREHMQKLLDTVNEVLGASELVKGKIQNGIQYKDGREEPIMEDGEYIKDPKVAKELLPVRGGFFFGNYDPDKGYDQWYYQSLMDTKKILEVALKAEDADFYYQSSW